MPETVPPSSADRAKKSARMPEVHAQSKASPEAPWAAAARCLQAGGDTLTARHHHPQAGLVGGPLSPFPPGCLHGLPPRGPRPGWCCAARCGLLYSCTPGHGPQRSRARPRSMGSRRRWGRLAGGGAAEWQSGRGQAPAPAHRRLAGLSATPLPLAMTPKRGGQGEPPLPSRLS